MKSLQQRLQSRISLRRNWIRELEGRCARAFRLGDREDGKQIRKGIVELGADQRMDKQLFALVLEGNDQRRYYDLPQL